MLTLWEEIFWDKQMRAGWIGSLKVEWITSPIELVTSLMHCSTLPDSILIIIPKSKIVELIHQKRIKRTDKSSM